MWFRCSVSQNQSGPMKISCATTETYICQEHTGLAVVSCLEIWLVGELVKLSVQAATLGCCCISGWPP